MIIFIESGRLGNQLFQYVALRSAFKRSEKLVLVGFDSLKNTFDGVDAIFVNKNTLLTKFLVKFARKLERMGWLDYIFNVGCEDCIEPKIIVKKKIPWLGLLYVKESYFQSEQFLDDEVIGRLRFKSHVLTAISSDNRLNLFQPDLIFVHIRRGDYLYWPSLDFPAVLDDSWYLSQIKRVVAMNKHAKFLFFTDDPDYVRDNFLNKIKNSDIFHVSEAIDMAVMAHCSGGILSASSFSWWAARLALEGGRHGGFIAPNFWVGHSKGIWYPSRIQSKFLRYSA